MKLRHADLTDFRPCSYRYSFRWLVESVLLMRCGRHCSYFQLLALPVQPSRFEDPRGLPEQIEAWLDDEGRWHHAIFFHNRSCTAMPVMDRTGIRVSVTTMSPDVYMYTV